MFRFKRSFIKSVKQFDKNENPEILVEKPALRRSFINLGAIIISNCNIAYTC